MPPLTFVGHSAKGRSVLAENLRVLNGYAEIIQHRQGKAAAVIYGAPGLSRWLTLPGSDGVRALYTTGDGRVFAVRGGGLYELFSASTSAYRGSLGTTSGPVSMADNGVHLMLVDGPGGYVLTLAANTFATITDPDFTGADQVAFIDGYFAINKRDTGQFQLTGLYSTDFDALDFATAEASSDRLLGIAAHHREVWLPGSKTTEVWFNAGTPDFPLQRIAGAALSTGIAAAHSMARLGESLCWLGANDEGHGVVWMAEGYAPQRISTHPVELAIQNYSTISDAIGWSQQQEGHHWYWLTFPTGNATWVYDAATQLWAERGYRHPTTGAMGRHRANCYTFGHGRHLVGDWENGKVYALDLDTYTDDGDPLVFEVITPPIFDSDGLHRLIHGRLQVDCQTGVGLDGSVQGRDPQLMMQMSNDGTQTWGSEHWRSMGAIGQTQARVQWWRLGASRDRRYKLSITDPVKRAILGFYVDVDPTAS